jgi:chemotaxis protein MotB
MGTDAEVRINEQKIRIMLSSPILFDSGRSELKTSSYPIMHEVAALIKDIPNRIVIEGHTDNQPVNTSEFKSNWELSAARAFSVVRYFIEKEKLDPERLAGLGYGEYRPLLANDSEDNRSRNRRVEVNIIRVAH